MIDGTPPSEVDFSIVIVNMNAADRLGECLRSIAADGSRASVQVILVDNASTDDSLRVAAAAYPALVCLPQSRNIGYVRANNIGLCRATGRFVMFLNNDAFLRPGCLDTLRRFLDQTPKAGAVSGQIQNPDGTDQGCARRFPTIGNAIFGRRSVWTRWYPNNRWSRRYMLGRQQIGNEPFEVEILSSACLVLRTALARELGGMDEDFALYWVDAELCHRIRRRGWSVFCVPAAKIVHDEGTGGSTKTWRQRCRAAVLFHKDAYHAYHKTHRLGPLHPRRLFAAAALIGRATVILVLQIVRPLKATSSGGRN